jgi:sulfopropanediol 3-dehydrogenase
MPATVEYLKEATGQSLEISEDVADSVRDILGSVRSDGDDAVRKFTRQFDNTERETLKVSSEEIESAAGALEADEREAIDTTIENVREFHEEQFKHIEGFEKEFGAGIRMGTRVVPIERAGVYIPGGEHPLVATPAMTIVPAKVAGADHIIACAPPQEDGTVTPAQLYAMDRAGVDEIYCIGGAQAIGAMAYGTDSVPAVDVVTGPGNVFTTEAKRQVFGTVGVDFLAGPTEVLIVTDETADPALVATDILAQAEHDTNSRPAVITTSDSHAEAIVAEIDAQLPDLRTEEVARKCWEANGEVAVVPDRETAVELANEYAMEHLQLMIENPRELVPDLRNYGSLFIGNHAPVVFGDKAIGTNHCLPTLQVARYSSGIWVGTYLKTPTHQEVTAEAAADLADHAAKICEIEGTHAHRLSAEARRKDDR